MSWRNCLLRFRLILRLSPISSSAVSTPAETTLVVNYSRWNCEFGSNCLCGVSEDAAYLCGCSFCLWYYKGQLTCLLLLALPVWGEDLWLLPEIMGTQQKKEGLKSFQIHSYISQPTNIKLLLILISSHHTYSEWQLVSSGYSIDCELGHAVSRSEALYGTWLNHNIDTSCRTVVRIQNLNLQADACTYTKWLALVKAPLV